MSADLAQAQRVEMTPNWASDILCHYTVDRKPDWTNVFGLTGKIMLGWWVPGMGNPIVINGVDGRLMNGQHRLIAVVLSGRPIAVDLVEVKS